MLEIGPIILRAWEKRDLEDVHRWENDFDVMLYSRGKPHNMVSYENVVDYYEEERKNERRLHYIIVLKERDENIGTAVIRLKDWSFVKTGSLGTYLDKKYWNRGIGKIVTLALLEISFIFLNLDRCEAGSIEYNKRAHKVLQDCGFKFVGRHRKSGYVFGRKWDWYFFDILKEEYLAQREELIKKLIGKEAEDYLKRVSFTELKG